MSNGFANPRRVRVPSITLKVDSIPGSGIEDVASSIHALASTHEICVECRFNDANLYAFPYGSANKMVSAYQQIAREMRFGDEVSIYSNYEGVTTSPIKRKEEPGESATGG